MGESSAEYITKLERENAALHQRINTAVRTMDNFAYRCSVTNMTPAALAGLRSDILTAQQNLRGK